jgi:hypothetical protein
MPTKRSLSGLLAGAVMLAASCTDLGGLSTAASEDAGIPDGAPPAVCAPGQKSCGGGCVELDDPAFGCGETSCERCSVPFAAVLKCQSGKCAVGTCQPGRADCDGRGDNGCEGDLGSPATCGSCAMACGASTPLCAPSGCTATCPTEAPTVCSNSCVDTRTSALHCGACGKWCPAAANAVGKCNDASCTLACNQGFAQCDLGKEGCEPTTRFYLDKDGDGFGSTQYTSEGCAPPPGFIAVSGDCDDGDITVHPGDTPLSAVPFATGNGQQSYDRNCNGIEEVDPNAMVGGTCQGACILGYAANVVARNVPGASVFCGSTVRVATCSECSVAIGEPAVKCR